MAAGFFSAVLVTLAPIVFWGATAAWWDQWVGFGVNMTRYGFGGERVSGFEAVRVGVNRAAFVSATLLAGLIAAPVGWIARGRPKVASERVWMAGFLAAWLAVELWASAANGLTYTHYAMVWLIPAVALIGLLFGGKTAGWPALVFAGIVVALGLWYSAPAFRVRLDLNPGFPPIVRHEDAGRHAAQERMVREVEQRTAPAETIFIWGMDPVVYAETGRLSAGPYAHPLDILLAPGYQSEAQFAALMSEMGAAPAQAHHRLVAAAPQPSIDRGPARERAHGNLVRTRPAVHARAAGVRGRTLSPCAERRPECGVLRTRRRVRGYASCAAGLPCRARQQ